jgi:hypothetical protein
MEVYDWYAKKVRKLNYIKCSIKITKDRKHGSQTIRTNARNTYSNKYGKY